MDSFEGRVDRQSHSDAEGEQNEFRLGYSFSRWQQARDLEGDGHLECVAGRESVNTLPNLGPNSWLVTSPASKFTIGFVKIDDRLSGCMVDENLFSCLVVRQRRMRSYRRCPGSASSTLRTGFCPETSPIKASDHPEVKTWPG